MKNFDYRGWAELAIASAIFFGCIKFLIIVYKSLPEKAPYIQKRICVIGSKDTIQGKFQKQKNFYLNLKDSSKIYIDKIVYEKDVK